MSKVQILNTGTAGTAGKIYTPIFSFLKKKVVNIAISELRPVSNERSGNFTFYKDILIPLFLENNGFL